MFLQIHMPGCPPRNHPRVHVDHVSTFRVSTWLFRPGRLYHAGGSRLGNPTHKEQRNEEDQSASCYPATRPRDSRDGRRADALVDEQRASWRASNGRAERRAGGRGGRLACRQRPPHGLLEFHGSLRRLWMLRSVPTPRLSSVGELLFLEASQAVPIALPGVHRVLPSGLWLPEL